MKGEEKIIIRLASENYKKKDYRKAWLFFSELYKKDQLDDVAFNQFLTCSRRLNKPDTLELFKEALDKFPLDLHIKRNFIEFLISNGRLDEAETKVNEILEKYPDDFYAIDLKAKIYANSDRIEQAIEEMDKKLEIPELTMSRNIHGKDYEIRKTYNAYFRLLIDYAVDYKIKDEVLHEIHEDGKDIDNINYAFDKIQCDEDLSKLTQNNNISSAAIEVINHYEMIADKIATVLKEQKVKGVWDKYYNRKIEDLESLRSLLNRAKNMLIKLYDEEKRNIVLELFKRKTAFISYSRNDRDFALNLKEHLDKAGVNVIMDEFTLKINDYLEGKLRKLVRDSDYVISIVSKDSLISEWVGLESIETLMNERYENETKKFISVVVDNRVFKYDFYIELLKEIDIKIDGLLDKTIEVTKMRASSYLFDISRERLFQLRNKLGDILIRIREYLSIEFSDEVVFEDSFSKLMDYLEEQKQAA